MILKSVQVEKVLKWEGFVEKKVLSQKWKSEEVMDDESGDDDRDKLTSEWGSESTQS